MAVRGWFPQLTQPSGFSPTTREFETIVFVYLDDPLTPRNVIEAYPQYPGRFSKNNQYPQYWCTYAVLEQNVQHPNIRTLRIQWSNALPETTLIVNGQPTYDDNPILRPLQVDLDFYSKAKTYEYVYGSVLGLNNSIPKLPTWNGATVPPKPLTKVTTSAGEPIFMQDEEQYTVFLCKKNIAAFSKYLLTCRMFTNSDNVYFQGINFPPGQLLISNIRGSRPQFQNGQVFYEATWSMAVAPDSDGWCVKLRDAGFHEKGTFKQTYTRPDGTQGTTLVPCLVPITIGQLGRPQYPSRPVLLTNSGTAWRLPGPGQTVATPQFSRTGPVMTTEGSLGSQTSNIGSVGLTDQNFQDSTWKFYHRIAVPFKKLIPLQ